MFEQLQATLPNLHRKLFQRLLYSLSSPSLLLVITLACPTFTNGQVNVSSSAQPNLARLKWSDGKVKWSGDGFGRATAAALADINSDGQVEILLPGDQGFVTALSIHDGSLIWRSDENRHDAAGVPIRSTGLITLSLKDRQYRNCRQRRGGNWSAGVAVERSHARSDTEIERGFVICG